MSSGVKDKERWYATTLDLARSYVDQCGAVNMTTMARATKALKHAAFLDSYILAGPQRIELRFSTMDLTGEITSCTSVEATMIHLYVRQRAYPVSRGSA